MSYGPSIEHIWVMQLWEESLTKSLIFKLFHGSKI